MRWLLFGVFAVLFALGAPVPLALLAACAAYLLASGIDPAIAGLRLINSLDSFVLLAVPLFLLAAEVMNVSGLTERVYRLAALAAGRRRAGLAHVNVLASIVFAGMTGSAIAEASGLGLMSIRAMTRAGYDRRFSAAVVASSSTIGPIIPPSIPMIIYSVIAGVSVEKLFLAGVTPGLLLGAGTMIIIAILARRRGYAPAEVEREALGPLVVRALPALLAPVLLLGGIYTGLFTPTEAAAVAAVYAAAVAVLLYRTLSLSAFWRICRGVGVTTGYLMLVISAAGLFGWILAIERIPQDLAAWLAAVAGEPWQMLLLINLLFLLLGCLMDTNSILVIFLPIILPAATLLGLDPVHLGVVVVLNLMIGLSTPPFGMLLFLNSALAEVPLGELIREMTPFLVMMLVVLFLITYIPILPMWLPALFSGG